jgi:hypothetical protein
LLGMIEIVIACMIYLFSGLGETPALSGGRNPPRFPPTV